MISIMYVLVLAIGGPGNGGSAMTNIPDFPSEEACKLAGEAFKIDATQAKEIRPRYYCLAVEPRLE